MTSHKDSWSSPGFRPIDVSAPRSKVPFSKDVLEAMERGDIDAAMRLANGKESAQPNKFFVVMDQFGQALVFVISVPGQLFARLTKKMPKKPTLESSSKSNEDAKQSLFTTSKISILSVLKVLKANFDALQKIFRHDKWIDFGNQLKNFGGKALSFAQGLVNPVDQWLVKKIEDFENFASKQFRALEKLVNRGMNWADETTRPYREIIRKEVERFSKALQEVQKWTYDKVEMVYRPIEKVFSDLYEATEKKVNELEEAFSRNVDKVKDKVVAAGEVVIHYVQVVPQVIAPFAYWIVKQAITPVGNIKQNIIYFSNKAKNAFKAMQRYGSAAGRFLGKGVEWVAVGGKAIASFIEGRIIPLLKHFCLWLARQLLILAKKLLKVIKALYINVRAFTLEMARITVHLSKLFWVRLKKEVVLFKKDIFFWRSK